MSESSLSKVCEHEVVWDYTDVYVDEASVSITGSCKKCDQAFMKTSANWDYSILDDKTNEWKNYDDELIWA